jgi:tetratricopeptide (TPR) repeat protein
MLTAAKLFLIELLVLVATTQSYDQLLRRGQELASEKRWLEAERAFRQAAEAAPRAVEPRLELARLYLERQQAATALDEIDQALSLARGEFAPLFLRGIALIQLEKFEEAALELATALDKRPADAGCRRALGMAAFRARDFAQACEVLQPLIESGNADSSTYALYGGALAGMGRTDESLAALESALRLEPHHREALLYLGQAELSRGRHEEAASAFARGLATYGAEESEFALGLAEAETHLGSHAEARARLESLLSRSPRLARAWFVKGSLEEAQKNYVDAATAYAKSIELGYDRADAHLRRGVSLAYAGDRQAAGEAFDRALEKDPQLAAAYYFKGILASQAGKPEEAAELLEQAAALGPAEGRTFIALADVRLVLRQYDRALAAAERAARSAELSGRAFYLMGIAHHQTRAFAEAKTCYQKAIALGQDAAEVYLNLGKLFSILSQYDEAQKALGEALRREPDLAEAHLQMGIVVTQRREYAAAVAHLERAIELLPSSAEAWYRKGVAESRQGGSRAAVASWKKALALDPQATEVYYRLGTELVKLGQGDEGEKLLAEFRERSARASRKAERGTRFENALMQALVLSKEGRDHEALRWFQESLQIDPENTLAYPALAEFHLLRGRAAEAEATLLQGLAHHPDSLLMRELLVSVFEASGNQQGAEQERRRLEELRNKK